MLNHHGDRLIATSGSHGSDITAQRMDDLDIASLQYVLSRNGDTLRGIDLGCGHGIHGIRLAMLQVNMLLIDITDQEQRLQQLAAALLLPDKLHYLQQDARMLDMQAPGPLNFVYSQRFLHYLRFSEAGDLVHKIAAGLCPSGKLFISASGLNSDLADHYAGKDLPIQERFHSLQPAIAALHGIREPVCLYSEEELIQLASEAGLLPERVWTSAFGNIKAIFVKPG